MRRILCLVGLILSGCFQAYDPDDDIRAVPVTNNPHIVPNYGNGLPGVGGPY